MITTTLRRIRAAGPCLDGWETLLRHLGKTAEDDEPLRFSTIIEALRFSTIVESNDIAGAIWCMRTLDDLRVIGTIAGRFAQRVIHVYEAEHPGDERVRHAADLAANGAGTPGELHAASIAASYAATSAATYKAAEAADAASYAAKAAAAAHASYAAAASDAADDASTAAVDAAAARAAERAAQAQIIRETLG